LTSIVPHLTLSSNRISTHDRLAERGCESAVCMWDAVASDFAASFLELDLQHWPRAHPFLRLFRRGGGAVKGIRGGRHDRPKPPVCANYASSAQCVISRQATFS